MFQSNDYDQESQPCQIWRLKKSLDANTYLGHDKYSINTTTAYDLLQSTSSTVDSNHGGGHTCGQHFRNQISNIMFTQMAVPGRDGKIHDITCYNCNEDRHFANLCPEKDCRQKKVALAQFLLIQKDMAIINPNWILLDTWSTVSIVCNPAIVNNITSVPNNDSMTIVTNGGLQFFNQKADLKILPLTVHFEKDSLANILSLSDIANLPGA
jgi:hypothetical protein